MTIGKKNEEPAILPLPIVSGTGDEEAEAKLPINTQGVAPPDHSDEHEAPASKNGCSERKRQANQANAQKSTGPRTARGKAFSRMNALKHGALAQKVIYDSQGRLRDESLRALEEQLLQEYGGDRIRTRMMIDLVLVSYWRNQQALALEQEIFADGLPWKRWNCLDLAHRYSAANEKALFKHLAALSELPGVEDDTEAGGTTGASN